MGVIAQRPDAAAVLMACGAGHINILRLGALATPATRRQSLPIQAVPSVAAHARQCRAQLLLTAVLFLVDVLARLAIQDQ